MNDRVTAKTTSYIESRLSALLGVLACCDWHAFPDDAHALAKIVRQRLESQLGQIQSIQSDDLPEDVQGYYNAAGQDLERLTPLIDYAVRAAESRNPQELRGPLLRLVRTALGQRARLVLFSQWYPFPLLYRYDETSVGVASEYLLVGFPAHEAENPLVYPLAGHELGHSLWRQAPQQIQDRINATVTELLRGEFANDCLELLKFDPHGMGEDLFWHEQPFGTLVEHVKRQCEEIFCDLVGVYVFGEAYMHAFHYAVAGHATTSPLYPSYLTRAQALTRAFKRQSGLDWDFPQFADRPSAPQSGRLSDRTIRFLRDVTDKAVNALVDEIIVESQQICRTKQLLTWWSNAERDIKIKKAVEQLQANVPILDAPNLQTILIAAWQADTAIRTRFSTKTTRVENDSDSEGMHLALLKEAVLKSLEVFEIQELHR